MGVTLMNISRKNLKPCVLRFYLMTLARDLWSIETLTNRSTTLSSMNKKSNMSKKPWWLG